MSADQNDNVEFGGDRYGYEDDVYGSCSCGETRRHRHETVELNPLRINRTMSEWLSNIESLPESQLPCNVSTVAYAIRVALAWRHEAEVWRDLFEQATSEPTDG